jgi:hypothetical protein
MSRRRRQSGLGLVELIVGMMVTTAVMVGLVGVIYEAQQGYTLWSQRVRGAVNVNLLPSAIQSDANVYLGCSPDADTLAFCAGVGGPRVATYSPQLHPAGGQVGVDTYDIIRTGVDGRQLVVLRSVGNAPSYKVRCNDNGSVTVGYVDVVGIYFPASHLDLPGWDGTTQPAAPGTVKVWFTGPRGGCGLQVGS